MSMNIVTGISTLPSNLPVTFTNQVFALKVAGDQWRNYVNDYTDAYEKAFTAFEQVLGQAQKDAEKVRELAFLVLSLGGASGFMSVFAGALRDKFVGAIVSAVTRRKLDRMTMAAAQASVAKTKPYISFAVGKAFDVVTQTPLDAAKDAWVANVEASFRHGRLDPYTLKQMMSDYYRNLYEGLMDWLLQVGHHPTLAVDKKVEIALKILEAPFATTAPQGSFLPAKPDRRMLLGLYMQFLLEQDFVEICKPELLKFGLQAYTQSCRQEAVLAPPSYRGISNAPLRYPSNQLVRYKTVGAAIAEGIDRVHDEVYPGNRFFGDPGHFASLVQRALQRELSYEWLIKAEQVLDRLWLSPLRV